MAGARCADWDIGLDGQSEESEGSVMGLWGIGLVGAASKIASIRA
jgi:hypothetical protein